MIPYFALDLNIYSQNDKHILFLVMAWDMKDFFSPSFLREDPVTPEPAFSTVADWLDSIKMSQYKEHFSSAGYVTLDSVLYVSVRLVSQLHLDSFSKN